MKLNLDFSTDKIQYIVKDSLGFIWTGSGESRLKKFDGYRAKTYVEPENPKIKITEDLFMDHDQRLWFVSEYDLNYYDYQEDRFKQFGHVFEDNLKKMLQATDSSIYLISEEDVYLLNPESQDFKDLEISLGDIEPEYQFANFIATDIFRDDLLIITDFFLVVIDVKSGQVKFLEESETLLTRIINQDGEWGIFTAFFDACGNILVGVFQPDGIARGYISMDYQAPFTKGDLFISQATTGFGLAEGVQKVQDPSGTLWFSTSDGLIRYNCVSGKLEDVSLSHELRRSPNGFFNAMSVDHDGLIWIYHDDGYLLNFDTQEKSSKISSLALKQEDGFALTSLTAFDSTILLGSSDGLFEVFIGKNTEIKRLSDQYVREVAAVGDSIIYCLEYDHHHDTHYLKSIDRDETQLLSSFTDVGAAFCSDRQGRLWYASDSLFLVESTGEVKLQPITIPEEDLVMKILEDPYGNLILIHVDWLIVYNIIDKHGDFYTIDDLGITEITCAIFDHEGSLWLGGPEELHVLKYDSIAKNLYLSERYGGHNGFDINFIVDDSNSGLWAGSGGKMYRFDQTEQSFLLVPWQALIKYDGKISFIEEDGFYKAISYRDLILLGSGNGIDYFKPAMVLTSNRNFPLALTEMSVGVNEIRPGSELGKRIRLEKSLHLTKHIYLQHDDFPFTMNFSLLDYRDRGTTLYTYSLEELNSEQKEEWNSPTISNSVTYTNLTSGTYKFQLKAMDGNGNWSDETREINITVLPPYWQTIWFKVLVILTIAIGLYGFYWVRSRKSRMEKLRLESMVQDRTMSLLQKNERIEQLHQEVVKANQAKLEFFTNVSHELRTPVTLICNPINDMLDMPNLNAQFSNKLKSVQASSRRLLTMLDQLLEFRKVESSSMQLKIRSGNLEAKILEIYQSFQAISEQRLIDYRLTGSFPEKDTWFDPDFVDMILYNLLSNAFKFTKSSGQISVKLRYENQFTKVNGSHSENHDWVSIAVSDDAGGIPENDVKAIFDYFYQSTGIGSSSGTGIGLALAKKLAQLHGGELEYESNQKGGSTFTLTLPVSEGFYEEDDLASDENYGGSRYSDLLDRYVESSLTDDQKTLIEDDQVKSGPRILLVEDESELAKYIKSILSEFQVSLAPNGKTGLEQALKEQPALIISDIMMPEMNGIELCRALKNNIITSHIPVILLTGKADEDTNVDGLETGADKFVSKPFNNRILIAEINSLLQERVRLKKVFSESTDLKISKEVTRSSLDAKMLDNLTEFILGNMQQDTISVEQMARVLGLSKTNLFLKLKSLTGQAPLEFANTLRLNKAAQMLQATDKMVKEIALEVGFSDVRYFRKCFVKRFGTSPGDYRRDHIVSEYSD